MGIIGGLGARGGHLVSGVWDKVEQKKRAKKETRGFPTLGVRRRSQQESGQANEVGGERSAFHL